ncbi:hypothetical protein NX722_06860 [Endozoicomonas gorgoniicola]|uniref:DUF5683 domain-containing protein n=1 Tax=Endozoicomonas gorgoniicola TaxID=1234144 RepID=A0ABT3MSK8_9GAMM|nr:hypothetical protein [Endozoicomonas gorgoniicola]MCW7552369.1 hypothetical protein [Endozoicomonas gorgoniicola]
MRYSIPKHWGRWLGSAICLFLLLNPLPVFAQFQYRYWLKIIFDTEDQITIPFRLSRGTDRGADSAPSESVASRLSNPQRQCLEHRGNACGCVRTAPIAQRHEPVSQLEEVRVEGHFTMPDGASQTLQLLPENNAFHQERLMTGDQINALNQQIALMAHILAGLRKREHRQLFSAETAKMSYCSPAKALKSWYFRCGFGFCTALWWLPGALSGAPGAYAGSCIGSTITGYALAFIAGYQKLSNWFVGITLHHDGTRLLQEDAELLRRVITQLDGRSRLYSLRFTSPETAELRFQVLLADSIRLSEQALVYMGLSGHYQTVSVNASEDAPLTPVNEIIFMETSL